MAIEGNAKLEYEKLNKIVSEETSKGIASSEHISLLRSINQKIELLKICPDAGQSIKKRQIPFKYFGDIDNLHRLELAFRWRMLYTISTDQIHIIDFILEIVNHKRYDKIFGYRKK